MDEAKIKGITTNFHRNIHALVVFAETIGNFADEHDRKTTSSVDKLVGELTSVFDEVLGNLSQTTAENLEHEVNGSIKDKKLSQEQKKQLNQKLITTVLDNEDQISQLGRTIKKSPPVQGNLLRRSALISLMSTFETLLSQLIREFYYKYPEALPAESKTLTLADLRDLGSVEEAEKFLIDNEIDSILRGNIQSQLMYFDKPIKISLKPIDKYIDNLIELSQRRNLLVHNDGIINRHYLTKTPKSFLESNIEEGQRVSINSKYLISKIETIHLVGTILIQQCFRKWDKSKIDEANDILIDLIYDSLLEENYVFTENLAEYAYSIDIKSEKDLRIIVVNHCISLREQEKTEAMEHILSKYDWSAVSLEFEIAVNALRGNEEKLYSLLDQGLAINKIQALSLNEWPLFNKFRITDRFKKYFQEKFPDFKPSSLERSDEIDNIHEFHEDFKN